MNNKRKITQDELRQHMKRTSIGTKKRIDSPLAKYSSNGELSCIMCNSVVKSEAVWSIHLNSKEHRGNIAKKKQQLAGVGSSSLHESKNLGLSTGFYQNPLKRPSSKFPESPPKKLKGILKNAPKPTHPSLPADFFKSNSSHDVNAQKSGYERIGEFNSFGAVPDTKEAMNVDHEDDSDKGSKSLPEGFFDDPVLDAKARNVEYRNPIEEELERFQREIIEEEFVSTRIVEEDNEEAKTQREIEQIDDQSLQWSKVLELEKDMEEALADKLKANSNHHSDLSSSEEDFDEFLDWRSKKSFK